MDAPLFRVSLPPGQRTGLRAPSQIMVDKIVSVPRSSVSEEIGQYSDDELDSAEVALCRWLGLS